MIIFYRPSNALCSSDKSRKMKHFKHHDFVGIGFLFISVNEETSSLTTD